MRRALGAGLLALLAAAATFGHDLRITDAVLVVRSGGLVQVDMVCDLDALAVGAAPGAGENAAFETLTGLDRDALDQRREALRNLLERRVKLRADGDIVPLSVSFPDEGRAVESGALPSYFGLSARLAGRLPADAAAITFMASRAFPPVHLTILDQRSLGGRREILLQGETSTPYVLAEPAAAPAGDRHQEQPLGVAGRYLALGFGHIIPGGLDHVLFVLGLYLFGRRWRPLLLQVSAFTVAHTITLGLAASGAVSLDPRIVEPLIALSIAWVAVENLLRRSGGMALRTAVVFAFGLLHGLGFAGVLGQLGLPAGAFLPALLGFNIGVELGQLTVVGLAFVAVGWARDKPWYRAWIVRPASTLIAAAGIWWLVARLMLPG